MDGLIRVAAGTGAVGVEAGAAVVPPRILVAEEEEHRFKSPSVYLRTWRD